MATGAGPVPTVARMEQGPSLFATVCSAVRVPAHGRRGRIFLHDAELYGTPEKEPRPREFFDGRPQMLGNQKALLAKLLASPTVIRGEAMRSGGTISPHDGSNIYGAGKLKAQCVSSGKTIPVVLKATRISAIWFGIAAIALAAAAIGRSSRKEAKACQGARRASIPSISRSR